MPALGSVSADVAGPAVPGRTRENGGRCGGRSPAVGSDPVRDRVVVTPGLVVGLADAAADFDEESLELVVVASGEVSPIR